MVVGWWLYGGYVVVVWWLCGGCVVVYYFLSRLLLSMRGTPVT